MVELTPEEVEVLTEDLLEGAFRPTEQLQLRAKARDHRPLRGVHCFQGPEEVTRQEKRPEKSVE